MAESVAPIRSSTQVFTEIVEIDRDLVLFRDGSVALVIATTAVNFGLLSQKEQDAIIYAYAGLLNSLSFPIQILIQTKHKDISAYLKLLEDQENKQKNPKLQHSIHGYRVFVASMVKEKEVLDKKFYVVLPFSAIELGVSSSLLFRPKKSGLPYEKSYILDKAQTVLIPKRDHILRLLSRVGLHATHLTTESLIKLFFTMFNPGSPAPDLTQLSVGKGSSDKPLTVTDIISPPAIEVDFDFLKVGESYCRSLFVAGYPRFVTANWLEPLVSFNHTLDISMYIYPTRSEEILENLKRKVGEMEATIQSDLKRGRVIEPSVQVALEDALALQQELAKGSERFFQFGLYVTIPAKTKEDLDKTTKQVEATLGSLLIVTKKAILQMEEGLKTTLPMGRDRMLVTRNMDTTSLATTFPFTTSELTANEGILYGLNEHNDSLIIFDRFTLENSNAVVFGKSGGGKSYMVKLEIMRSLMFDTEVIVIDPENEYESLTHTLGGEYIRFKFGSATKINPFDLAFLANQGEGQSELGQKILSLHGFFRVVMGKLTPTEDALLDRALIVTYKQKGVTPDPTTHSKEPPLMEDLYKTLMGMEESLAKGLADRIEKFVKGSLVGIFDQQTNIEIRNQLTVFSIRDLEDELRPIAMYLILDFIWNKIRHDKKRRLLIVDEAWYMMKYPDSAQFLYSIAKRARKYYLGLTTITQDVEDFLATEMGKAIIQNSSMQILLKQSSAAIDTIAQTFYLSEGEKHLLLAADVGQGLFFAGPAHAAMRVIASPEEHAVATTRPQEAEIVSPPPLPKSNRPIFTVETVSAKNAS